MSSWLAQCKFTITFAFSYVNLQLVLILFYLSVPKNKVEWWILAYFRFSPNMRGRLRNFTINISR